MSIKDRLISMLIVVVIFYFLGFFSESNFALFLILIVLDIIGFGILIYSVKKGQFPIGAHGVYGDIPKEGYKKEFWFLVYFVTAILIILNLFIFYNLLNYYY